MQKTLKYNRIMLKLSGEALMGDDAYGINRATIERIVAEISEVARLGVDVRDTRRRSMDRQGTWRRFGRREWKPETYPSGSFR